MNNFLNNRHDIIEWLEEHRIMYYDLVDDSLYGYKVNVRGVVSLSKYRHSMLAVKFGEVEGDFFINYSNITSLEGCPDIVRGNFSCNGSKLETLCGAPREVSKNFDCCNNKLISLEGAPRKVGGIFACNCNKLTNLKGMPSIIGGSIFCHSNQLTSLEGAPENVNGGFNCSNNKLESLKYAPLLITKDLRSIENPIKQLEMPSTKIGGSLVLENCPLDIKNLELPQLVKESIIFSEEKEVALVSLNFSDMSARIEKEKLDFIITDTSRDKVMKL